MSDLIFRFLIGGVVVSLFAMLGDVLRPKSFAGLFSAAPSVALATLGLTIHKEGKLYAAFEAKNMLLGAAAFLAYAALVSFALRWFNKGAIAVGLSLIPIWFIVSLGAEMLLSGRW